MAVSYATANGHRLRTARVTIPTVGAWVSDVFTDDDAADFSDGVTLTVGDLSLGGTLLRGEPWQGSTRARFVGGHGGWRQTLPPKYYATSGGARRSVVIRDLASECGEKIGETIPSEKMLGVNFARPEQSASATLYDLGVRWHVMPSGATSFVDWSTALITSEFDVTEFDAARGIVTIATDSPAAFMPGRIFKNSRLPLREFVISDVVHRIQPDTVRIELWCLP